MRNLKKILALVLALVMSMSVMTIASADFKDSDKVNAKFETAVEVLNALGVFQGYEDGTFKPTGAITRAEVAAIIYRIDTGDVAGDQVQIYADYNKFADVKSTDWYAGYVNYCANALYIRGYDETTFGPNDKVTGYQALAMILRVVGYDKNGEFSGSAWQIETAKYANKLGITRNVDVNTLGVAATRELVAELLFRTIAEVPQVTYTLLQGYNQYQDTFPTADSELNDTIGWEMFRLDSFERNDVWGRPQTVYTSYGYEIASFTEAPIVTYTEATLECDIAAAMYLQTVADIPTYYNGVKGSERIDPLCTNVHNDEHLIGEQGTFVEIYWDRIVVIDTYLSVVTKNVSIKTDKNGHIARYPSNDFYLWGAPVETVTRVGSNEYAKGEYVLVMYNEANGKVYPYAIPTTVEAKQTYIWWNAEKHTIAGKEYMDNANYALDAAEFDKTTDYIWFFDTCGNVIGSQEIYVPAADRVYAVVLGAQWVNGQMENGKAMARLYFLNDGSISNEQIAYIGDKAVKYDNTMPADPDKRYFEEGVIFTTYQYNKYTTEHLYEVVETKDGLALIKVENELASATLIPGISQIGATHYTDNETTYFFYNPKTGAITSVKGYEALTSIYLCENVDVVFNGETGFVQYAYIPVSDIYAANRTVFEYVYITDDAVNYELDNKFALLGVVDGEGNTEPLYFAKDYAGNEQATAGVLNNLAKYAQDTLYLVETSASTGLVVGMTPVALDGITTAYINWDNSNSEYVAWGEFEFYSTGVLKIGAKALNVNHNTTIINDGKVGVAINNLDYLYGSNLYVVYDDDNFAQYIFVTSAVRTNVVANMVKALNAVDFMDVSAAFTYEVEKDAEIDYTVVAAAVEEYIVENSSAVAFIDGMTKAADVTVAVAYNETTEKFDVTVTAGGETKTVSITIVIKEKVAE